MNKRYKKQNNRALRRQECEERQAQRNKRTTVQQLARLDEGGYAAVKERARLAS